jgi:RNA polymerase sigma factor (sigma-70 family)
MRDQTANVSGWSASSRADSNTVLFEEPVVAALRGGCPHALAMLYRRYATPTSSYLRSLAYRLGAAELAQQSVLADLVQEVFLRAFAPAARARYSPLTGVRAYLNTIARHCLIDLLRRRRRELLVADARDLLGSVAGWVDPWQEARDARRDLLVSAYLAGLPARLGEVYEQRFVLGCSQEQASRTLGVSRRQVRTLEAHLARGLRRALSRSEVAEAPLPRKRLVRGTRS